MSRKLLLDDKRKRLEELASVLDNEMRDAQDITDHFIQVGEIYASISQ